MKDEQKKLWIRLMAAFNSDGVACDLYLARLYTQRYGDDMYGWVVLADVLAGIAEFQHGDP